MVVPAALLTLALGIAAAGQTGSSKCPYGDEAWAALRAPQREKLLARPEAADLTPACFLAYARRLAGSGGDAPTRLILALRDHSGRYGLTTSFLLELLGTPGLHLDSALGTEIARVWEKYNSPFRDALAQLQNSGMYPDADSLYRGLHACGVLDAYDLLRWAQVKGILGAYEEAGRVFCEIATRQPNLAPSCRSQLAHMLGEAATAQQRTALAAYRDCRLASGAIDSAAMYQWLALTSGRYGLYREQTEAVIAMGGSRHQAGRRLVGVAEGRFRRGQYAEVVGPATEAFTYLESPAERRRAAALTYQAYMQLGSTDSALAWFGRADLSDPESRADAAVLYQKAGLRAGADSVIGLLPPSITRDTLIVRQHIYAGRLGAAASLVKSLDKNARWTTRKRDLDLWRTRVAVFAGDILEATLTLDSASFEPGWTNAQEMLDYRLGIKRIGPNPAAFAFWGRLARAVYTNRLADSAGAVDVSQFPAKTREYLAVMLATALIDNDQPVPALRILNQVPVTEASPRVKYFRAEAMFMQGMVDQARAALENLIVESPQDIFSTKARIYLLRLERSVNM